MRALSLSFALILAAALPMAAQTARMFKVDVVAKSGMFQGHKMEKSEKKVDGPTEMHMRMPLTLVKAFLQSMGETELKVNGKGKKGFKADEIIKLIETSKAGDLLLEITTDKGDHVKISLE